MANTHILSQMFEYFEPRTIEEAVSLLSSHGEKSKIIAKGTDLLVQMKMGEIQPQVLINIARIPVLRYLTNGEGLCIGCLTTFRDLKVSALIRQKYSALFEGAQSVTSVQIQNMGTIGGNLCNASPAADSAPPLLAFDGKVRLAEKGRERILPLEEFFVGNGVTAISPKELLVEIQLPEFSESTGSAFIKMARVAADLAKISIATVVVREGDVCRECRMAMGGVARVPMRIKKAEEVLRGKKFTGELLIKAGLQASQEIQPRSRRSTAYYKKEVTKILVRDSVLLAWKRANGTDLP